MTNILSIISGFEYLSLVEAQDVCSYIQNIQELSFSVAQVLKLFQFVRTGNLYFKQSNVVIDGTKYKISLIKHEK